MRPVSAAEADPGPPARCVAKQSEEDTGLRPRGDGLAGDEIRLALGECPPSVPVERVQPVRVHVVVARVLGPVRQVGAVRSDARRDHGFEAAAAVPGLAPELVAGLNRQVDCLVEQLPALELRQAARAKTRDRRLVGRRRDAIGTGGEKRPVHFPDRLRRLEEDPCRPQIVVQVASTRLEGRGQAPIQ